MGTNTTDIQLPWGKMNEFILACGNIREPKAFCNKVVKGLAEFIPYDQARVYYTDANGHIYDQTLIGASKAWSSLYLDYFSKVDGGRYAITEKSPTLSARASETRAYVRYWMDADLDDEFVTGYIRPQGICCGIGFALHDANRFPRANFGLDRMEPRLFTQRDLLVMNTLLQHLDNLFKNMYVKVRDTGYERYIREQYHLTKRENEIADMLCRGITPANIAKQLCLSLTTVYRHIANIHGKLGISTCQELVLKLTRDAGQVDDDQDATELVAV